MGQHFNIPITNTLHHIQGNIETGCSLNSILFIIAFLPYYFFKIKAVFIPVGMYSTSKNATVTFLSCSYSMKHNGSFFFCFFVVCVYYHCCCSPYSSWCILPCLHYRYHYMYSICTLYVLTRVHILCVSFFCFT